MLERLAATRVVADPAALEDVDWPADATVLPLAADDVLVVDGEVPDIADPHAIVVADESFAGAWLDEADALDVIARYADWPVPDARPVLCQGAVAAVPAKVWFGGGRALVLVPAPFAHELQERLA